MTAAGDHTLRTLTADDVDAYMALREHSFGFPSDEDTRPIFVERMPRTVGAFDAAGALVASAGQWRLETFVAGRQVPLLGIASIQTSPSVRRRGIASRLLAHGLELARDEGIGWGLLYPFDPRFYERSGWQSLPSGVRLRLPMSRWQRPTELAAEELGSDLRRELQPLHLRCAAQWSFTNARTIGPWDVWSDMRPPPGERSAAYRVPDGYAVLRLREEGLDGTVLEVLDASWCSAAGRRNVLGVLAAYRGQAERIELEVPRDDGLAWAWADRWQARANETCMARVVDLPAALAALPAARELPPLTLHVVDDAAPWNAGTFRLLPAPGGCACERTVATPDVTLDARALPLLLGGAARPRSVVRAGLAEGDERALATLFALSGGVTSYRPGSDRF